MRVVLVWVQQQRAIRHARDVHARFIIKLAGCNALHTVISERAHICRQSDDDALLCGAHSRPPMLQLQHAATEAAMPPMWLVCECGAALRMRRAFIVETATAHATERNETREELEMKKQKICENGFVGISVKDFRRR